MFKKIFDRSSRVESNRVSTRFKMIFSLLISLLLATPTLAFDNSDIVDINIDITNQEMSVRVGGAKRYTWPVSTARKGYETPLGKFKPTRLHEEYYSQLYEGSPMPYSIFFHEGYAIHGTTAIKRLGHPASHGCVRLDPENAEKLFKLVSVKGRGNTFIRIFN
ncbi:L,D-transpeptidase [uncultured Cohaesibacter sp.]|uniref:L,D-transpeptidase n=1 Tax=uncultured Cohaesibacter sp. TaxID=1002546 RepID=UPI00292FD0A7|nr:L,D-transpeptidase [uncultured Cohaesibacter sp.]